MEELRRRLRRRVVGVPLLLVLMVSMLTDLGSCNDAGRGV